ncbi:MAG: glutamyl-tRNA reductase [Bacteroidales bacterium]|nr:glutamyl-tRNA reductase [Bacteroidales bacterium]
MILYKSINHKNTDLSVREQGFWAIDPKELPPSVFLKTCNRMELYYGQGDVPDSVARHLFRVASGLESALIGEGAVQGQVKEAYLEACKNFNLPSEMHKLFEFALQTGKRVRTQTHISQGAVSHSLATIEMIERERIQLSDVNVTVIGVNKLTSDLLKFLKNKGAKTVFLANRSKAKAQEMALPFGIEVFELKEKQSYLPKTDILITATSAPHYLVNESDCESLNHPMLAIDLAFPRNINPNVVSNPNVHLYNIEDVEKIMQDNIIVRENEVRKAEQIIENEIAQFQNVLLRRMLFTI